MKKLNKLEQELISANYLKSEDIFGTALCIYQKKIKNDVGTKYNIDVLKYNTFEQTGEGEDKIKWEISLQFQLSISTIDITLFSFVKEQSLKEVERYVNSLWHRLDAHYYES